MIGENDSMIYENLKHFYQKINKTRIEEKVKIDGQSIFIGLIKLAQNKVSKLLKESTLPGSAFQDEDIKNLINSGFICESENIDKLHEYIITAKGVWAWETYKKIVDIDQVIEFIQETKYSTGVSKKPLKDIEKTVLLAMLAMRNFSPDAAMDLNEKGKSDYWIEVFDKVAQYLNSNGCIEKNEWQPNKAGNEHPIMHIMRRANDLPQKTKHIYGAAGNNQYFLDIANDEGEQKQKLSFLFSIIIKKPETLTDVRSIHSFLTELAYNRAKNVRKGIQYIHPQWDRILEEALEDYYYA